ncbi:hypothetical protein [Streptomyces antimycoticus]|uniref:hypothetical protein n=1 Tax=Streptomyces antimycoticus TaxID=68175 RepID=UPI00386DD0AD|nr:hypothetical protein OG751_03810 [Streptomyces antimycoticus]
MTTAAKGHCRVCGRPYQLKGDGTVRSHWARNPDGTAAAGLKDCGGVGEPPAGAAKALDRILADAHTGTALADIINPSNDNKEK